jgi:hypothetical protein
VRGEGIAVLLFILLGEAWRGFLNPIPIDMEREVNESEQRRDYYFSIYRIYF